MYKFKDYIMPSGQILQIQGYENYALDYLLQTENVCEDDIITGCKNVPTIWYNDIDGKKRRHFVDIFIPNQNRCIEVKSTWTAHINNATIFLKQLAAKELGYNYEIWVYDGKGQIVNKC
jgi:DNA repair protein RadC